MTEAASLPKYTFYLPMIVGEGGQGIEAHIGVFRVADETDLSCILTISTDSPNFKGVGKPTFRGYLASSSTPSAR